MASSFGLLGFSASPLGLPGLGGASRLWGDLRGPSGAEVLEAVLAGGGNRAYLDAWGAYEVGQVWWLMGLGRGTIWRYYADLLSELSIQVGWSKLSSSFFFLLLINCIFLDSMVHMIGILIIIVINILVTHPHYCCHFCCY